MNLAEAHVVVAGGKGMGDIQNFQMIHELADAIGATVGEQGMLLRRDGFRMNSRLDRPEKPLLQRSILLLGFQVPFSML